MKNNNKQTNDSSKSIYFGRWYFNRLPKKGFKNYDEMKFPKEVSLISDRKLSNVDRDMDR